MLKHLERLHLALSLGTLRPYSVHDLHRILLVARPLLPARAHDAEITLAEILAE